MAVLASLDVRRLGGSLNVRGRSLDVRGCSLDVRGCGLDMRGLGRQWGLRSGGNSGSLTSLKVFEIFPGFEVQRLEVTGVKRRVGTNLQIHLEKLAGRQVVVDFTSLDIISGLTSVGSSKCGSTEEGDGKESDFRSVLHDVLVIRGLRTRVELDEEVSSSSKDRPKNVGEC
jgi:hypothetical protein